MIEEEKTEENGIGVLIRRMTRLKKKEIKRIKKELV